MHRIAEISPFFALVQRTLETSGKASRQQSPLPIRHLWVCHALTGRRSGVMRNFRYYSNYRSPYRLAWSRQCTDLGHTEPTSVFRQVQQRISAKFHPDRLTFGRMAPKNLFSACNRAQPCHAYGWDMAVNGCAAYVVYVAVYMRYMQMDKAFEIRHRRHAALHAFRGL